MPLDALQTQKLNESIVGYDFPSVYYDFAAGHQVDACDIAAVESEIQTLLRSNSADAVRNGLANVLYWGYARMKFRQCRRVNRFRRLVTDKHLMSFKVLLAETNTPTLLQIKELRIPEFSGVSFVSKVLMFLNPDAYCVLDRQLASLSRATAHRALSRLVIGTQIPITHNNQSVYDAWRVECSNINIRYYGGQYRCVDIERGFFNLVQHAPALAKIIYAAA